MSTAKTTPSSTERVDDEAWLKSILGEPDKATGRDVAVDEDEPGDSESPAVYAEGEASATAADPAGGSELIDGDKTVDAAGENPKVAAAADDSDADAEADEEGKPRRFNPAVVGGGIAVLALALVISYVVAMAVFGDSTTPQARRVPPAKTVAATAPPVIKDDSVANDTPLQYVASAPCSKKGGATAAQSVDGSDPNNAWVCPRDGFDGQTLLLDLGRTFTVTSIGIVPGWVGTDASGVDQWNQHRVVTRIQYVLRNGEERNRTEQDTKNVHGEAMHPIKGVGERQGVLASKIEVTILQTSRPPAESAAPQPSAAPGGFLDTIVAPDAGGPSLFSPGAANTAADPVDATFAVSSIKVYGHESL